MKFREDINGLRAIAVIAVVLFHFNPSWMPGGFAGVDVFFVISGFLMTGIIFKGIEQENFSILKFYVARANRIIPALAAVCLMLFVFGWFFIYPLEYRSLGLHAFSSIGFISNIIYWLTSGSYFGSSSDDNWLLHTWSLSVEWQFYIIYPIVLVLMRKFTSLNTIKLFVLLTTIIGFIFCVFSTYKWPTPSYYLLSSRAWEMMIGGVAYLYPFSIKENKKKYVEWLGVTMIICSYLFISEENAWPGYLAVFPVLGSFLIIQSQRAKSLITGNPIFQKIGAWSYSIYLWHWPLVVSIYYFSLSDEYIYIGLFLSILLGFLSNKYIEKIKFKNDFITIKDYLRCKPLYIAVFTGAIGLFIYLSNGLDSSIRRGASTPQAKFLVQYKSIENNLDSPYWLKCNTYMSLTKKNTLSTDSSCIEKVGTGGIFLWGDSHAEALSFGLRELLEESSISFYQKTSSTCEASLSPVLHLSGKYKIACDYSNKTALENIAKIKPKLVIIAQANHHNKTDWPNITEHLLNLGAESVLLVGPIPQWRPSLPKVITKPKNWGNKDIFINDVGLDKSIIEIDNEIKHLENSNQLHYVSLVKSLCTIEEGKYYCRTKLENGDLLQFDYGHLTPSGSKFIINNILADKISYLLDN